MNSHIYTQYQPLRILRIGMDSSTGSMIDEALESQFIEIKSVRSLGAAASLRDSQWNCWILDPDAEKFPQCLSSMHERKGFPYIIVISGLRNMRLSFMAAQLGVLDVFDKSPDFPLDNVIDSVFRTAALSYLFNGKSTGYMPAFLALKNNLFTSASEWAFHQSISLRYLERLCIKHFGLSPRYILPLYYNMVASIYASSPCTNIRLFKRLYSFSDRKFFHFCRRFVSHRCSFKHPLMLYEPSANVV